MDKKIERKNNFKDFVFEKIDFFVVFVLSSMLLICSPYYSIILRGVFWWGGLVWGLCIFLYHALVKKDVPWKNPYYIIALAFSLLINITCLINGAFARYGLGYFINAIFVLVCFLPFKDEDKSLINLSTIIVIVGCLYSIVDFITFALSGQSFSFRGTRINGIWGNPNGAGMFIAVAFMFLFYLYKYASKTWHKVLLALATLIMLGELLLSGCRNALFGLFAAIFVIAFCFIVRLFVIGSKQQKKMLSISLSILLVLALVLMISPFGQNAYHKLFNGGTSGRGRLWDSGLHYASKHILLGDNQVDIMKNVGKASVEIGYTEEDALMIADTSGEASVHNCFIHVLLVGGLVSLIPYLLMIIGFYFKGFKCLKYIKVMDKDEFFSCMFYTALFSLVLAMAFFESFVTSINIVPLSYYFAYAVGSNTYDKIEKKYK